MFRVQFLLGVLGATSLAGCGGDSTSIDQPSNRPANSISIVAGAQNKGNAAFSPNPLTIAAADGGVVKWFNDDGTTGSYGTTGTAHNITADAEGSFASGTLPPGQSFEATFTVAGTYGYHCSIHPTMKGTVIVSP
jgi:plastocyanin